MNTLLSKLGSLKLSLTQYALSTLSLLLTGLLLLLQYKNKTIHKLRVDLLASQYDVKINQMQKATLETSQAAKDAYSKYIEAKEKYINNHGGPL